MRSATLAFLLGVCAFWQLPTYPPPLAWLLPLALLGLALRYSRWRLPGCLAAGLLWAALQAALSLGYALPAALEGRRVIVEGEVAGLPETGVNGRLRLTLRAKRLNDKALGGLFAPKFRLNAYRWRGELPRAGEQWRFETRLRRAHAPLNPGAPDGELWLIEQGLRATGTLSAHGAHRRLQAAPFYAPDRWRESLRDKIATALADRALRGLIVALVLGDDSAVSEAQWRVFRRSGTAHLIVISGSHITLVAGLVFYLARALWRRSERLCLRVPAGVGAALLGGSAAAGYSVLAGFEVPVQRALVMLAVLTWALLSRRRYPLSTSLCLALLAVLLYDSKAVLSAGFWLSFGAVSLIAWLVTGRPPERAWRTALRVQLAVSLGLSPLLLLLFQQASLIAPVANLLAVPWFSLLVLPMALLGTLLIPLSPLIGGMLLRGAESALSWLYAGLTLAAEPSWAVWPLGTASLVSVALGSLGLLILLAPRGWPARGLGAVLLIPMLADALGSAGRPALRLMVLDVGQGLATVVMTERHVLVYDAGWGERDGYSAGARLLAPVLRAQGVRQIDTLIVSHSDADHAGGVQGLLAELPARQVVGSWPGATPCRAGQSWRWDGVEFEIVHPDGGHWRGNNGSCVLRIAMGSELRILLTGDIEKRAERALLGRLGTALQAEVLVAPHHGSAGASSADFVAAVKPQLVIFPVGYRNRFGFPRPAVLERYRLQGAAIARTDFHGAVTVEFSPGKPWELQAWRLQNKRLWRDGPHMSTLPLPGLPVVE